MTNLTTSTDPSTARTASVTAIGGAVSMLIGAALYFSSGANDLWAALADGEMAAYLISADAARGQLVANHSLWIVGVLLMGIAIRAMASIGGPRRGPAAAAVSIATTAVPLAIVSFITMVSLAVQLAPNTTASSVATAEVIGWIGARADDLATVLIIGVAPLLVARAARGDWLPRWLAFWAHAAAAFGTVFLVGVFVPALSDVGFLVVPVGVLWMLAAGIVIARSPK